MREWFTLLEVIVTTLCVALLTVILLPGMLVARDTAREQSCQHSLRQLGTAFFEYEKVHGGLPPRRSGFNDGNAYGGWGGFILPHLLTDDQATAYDTRFDFFDPRNKQIVETQLPVFLCPASPAERFVQIQSQASTKSLNPNKETVYSCKAAAVDFITSNGVQMARSGYGINAMGQDGRIGNQRQPMTDNQDLPLSKVTDGLSNTLLLIEQAGRPAAWYNREKQPGDGQFGMSPNARGAWAGWGSISFGAVNPETGQRPPRGDSTDCSVNCNNWLGIYGFHKEGGNVLFCDGSVRLIGKKLDPLTFAYLTIRDDGHLIQHDDF
ncbi:DUF1559 domain-containing protein [Gimesia sp.]|uniref:DUF1559 family PulG-like putative transporter n=1 Tax=Gimesia sp. TaxID=2024833 RepID=UPI0032EDCE95